MLAFDNQTFMTWLSTEATELCNRFSQNPGPSTVDPGRRSVVVHALLFSLDLGSIPHTRIGWVERLVVNKGYRGAGVGRDALNLAEMAFTMLGAPLILMAVPDNVPALVHLAGSLGWKKLHLSYQEPEEETLSDEELLNPGGALTRVVRPAHEVHLWEKRLV